MGATTLSLAQRLQGSLQLLFFLSILPALVFAQTSPAPAQPTGAPANGHSPQYNGTAINLTWQRMVTGFILMPIGLLLTFRGYRHWRFTMFLAGFLTGVVIMFSILSNAEPANGWNDTQIIYVFSSIAAGFIIGAFCFFFNRFCSFILGGIAGLTLAMYILAWRDGTLIHSRGGRIGLLVGTAGFFVIIGLFLGRRILIPASVMLGSYITIAGLDMFARTGFTESIKLFFTTDENVVYFVTANLYIMLGAIGGLIVMGMVYQFLAWRNRRQRMVSQGRTIHSHSDDWTLLHPKKNRTIRPDPTYPDGNYPQNYNTNHAGTSTNPALGDDGLYHEKKWYKRNPFKRHPKREVDNYGDNRASYSSNAALNT